MEFYESKDIKKTRKEHICFLCRLPIPKQTACFYESGKYDGDMFSRHSHHECSSKWRDMNLDVYDDEWLDFECMSEVYPHDKLGWWRKQINEKYSLGFEPFDMIHSKRRIKLSELKRVETTKESEG